MARCRGLSQSTISLTPSVGGHVQDTITAHLAFPSTDLAAVLSQPPPPWCQPNDVDPSGTGLGLAAWIETVFTAIRKDSNGGPDLLRRYLSFRLTQVRGFGYIFRAPLILTSGHLFKGPRQNQLVVGICTSCGAAEGYRLWATQRAKVAAGSRVTSGNVLQ